MDKTQNPKGESDEIFFVEVKEPAEVRRNILESLKSILEMLQRFEKFKHLRHEKLMKIQKLRSLVKDANKNIGDLKAKLPQASFKGMMMQEQSAKPEKKVQAKKKEAEPEKPQKKEKTELDRLEEQLSAIEGKLKSFI